MARPAEALLPSAAVARLEVVLVAAALVVAVAPLAEAVVVAAYLLPSARSAVPTGLALPR